MNQFKLFVENDDIFGFQAIDAKKELDKDREKDDEQPIRPFNVQWMMDVLSRKKIFGRIRSTDFFLDHVLWGEKRAEGSIRVRLTPNIEILIERSCVDLNGTLTWVLKAVFKPKLQEFAGKEEIVAQDAFAEVENIYNTAIDSASENFDGLLHLTKKIADTVRIAAPAIYEFQQIKQVNPYYYIVSFSIRNAGVGKLIGRGSSAGRLSPEATIDVNYNKEKGLIHIIVATVSMGGNRGDGWEMDIPFLDSWFAPSQNKYEIIDSVVTALKYY